MRTIDVIDLDGEQAVKLPDGFRFATGEVTLRRFGEAVILSPSRPGSWPDRFFDDVRIDDPAFSRSDQGETPPAPVLG